MYRKSLGIWADSSLLTCSSLQENSKSSTYTISRYTNGLLLHHNVLLEEPFVNLLNNKSIKPNHQASRLLLWEISTSALHIIINVLNKVSALIHIMSLLHSFTITIISINIPKMIFIRNTLHTIPLMFPLHALTLYGIPTP